MKVRTKFNLVLLLALGLGIGVGGYLSQGLLENNAKEEVFQKAGIIMEAAMSVRRYTVDQIQPGFQKDIGNKFPPQVVPAYAATEVFNLLRQTYPDYTYKEATLNPTNERDKASDWEADIVQQFRNFPDKKEIVGDRESAVGPTLYLARPIKIGAEACLRCHSTPATAPKSIISTYGDHGGFNWKLNEIVGAQIVSVPTALAHKRAMVVFWVFILSLGGVFFGVFIVLNFMLGSIVIRPIVKMSKAAEKLSSGDMNVPEFPVHGRDEISMLANSFNLLRRSLEKAMSLLE